MDNHPYGKRGFGDRLQRMVQGMGAGPQGQAHFDQFQTNHPHFAQHLANRADAFFQNQGPGVQWNTGQGPLSFANFLRYRAAGGSPNGSFMPNAPAPGGYHTLPYADPSTPSEMPAAAPAAPTTPATGSNGFTPDPSGGQGGFDGGDDMYARNRRRR